VDTAEYGRKRRSPCPLERRLEYKSTWIPLLGPRAAARISPTSPPPLPHLSPISPLLGVRAAAEPRRAARARARRGRERAREAARATKPRARTRARRRRAPRALSAACRRRRQRATATLGREGRSCGRRRPLPPVPPPRPRRGGGGRRGRRALRASQAPARDMGRYGRDTGDMGRYEPNTCAAASDAALPSHPPARYRVSSGRVT